MAEFDTGLPSARQIQTWIKGQQNVEIKLSTGDVFVGKIRWQDPQCICLIEDSEQPILIWRQMISYSRAK
ncbi:MAG: Hfq-related RNA-binding protein [Microcystaceae cyanobacterium]